jgi:hypothetical protein
MLAIFDAAIRVWSWALRRLRFRETETTAEAGLLRRLKLQIIRPKHCWGSKGSSAVDIAGLAGGWSAWPTAMSMKGLRASGWSQMCLVGDQPAAERASSPPLTRCLCASSLHCAGGLDASTRWHTRSALACFSKENKDRQAAFIDKERIVFRNHLWQSIKGRYCELELVREAALCPSSSAPCQYSLGIVSCVSSGATTPAAARGGSYNLGPSP